MNKSISKIRKLEKEIEKLVNDKNIDITEIQELFLEKVIKILDISEGVFEGREFKNDSDYKLKVLKRYESILNRKSDIKDVDELLNIFLESLETKLSKDSIKLDYGIYPSQGGITKGDGVFENEKESVEKYKEFLNILMNRRINLDDIVVFEEELNEKRMRKYPYRIIYISEGKINKTVLISDEIGQATFIYNGIIKIENFKEIEKGEEIEGLLSNKIIYGANYSSRLEENIFGEENEEVDDKFKINVSENIKGDVKLKEIVEWQNFIYSKKGKLEKEANIYEIDGRWYFGDSKGEREWMYLRSFPNSKFNKDNNIGNKNGSITNKNDLKLMFKMLGLKIATEQDEIIRWRRILEGYMEQLEKEANIYCIDNIWYFGDGKAQTNWKKLIAFPSGYFNIKNSIGDKFGIINSIKELKNMFDILGLKVASEQDEIIRWRRILEGYMEQLEKEANIYCIDNIWYFGDIKGLINIKYLRSFPNFKFNKDNNIGNKQGIINSVEELKKMFEILGLEVASEEDEIIRWKRILEGYMEQLEKEANIYCINNIWYFSDSKGSDNWKYLKVFPNTIFNKENCIGDKGGRIHNGKELKKLFKILGLKVATEQEENIRWRRILEGYMEQLEMDANVYCIENIWFFGKYKGLYTLKFLRSFPNAKFNRYNGIGDNKGRINKLKEFKNMFKILGLRVATEEEELERKNNM